MAIRLRDINPAVFLNNVAIGTSSASNYTGYKTLTLAGDDTYGCLMDFFKGSTRMGSVYTNGTTDFRVGSIASVPFKLIAGANKLVEVKPDGSFIVGSTEIANCFNGTGNRKIAVFQGSDSTTTVADCENLLCVVNNDDTTNNMAGFGFGWTDTDGNPHYLSASINCIMGPVTEGQYREGELAFLTSTTSNAAPSEKMRITSTGVRIGTGTFEHAGLAFSTGTSVDQLTTFTKSMQLDSPTYWFDTGIDDGDLATGVYIFSMHVNDYGVGGTHYDETYSGMMSWFASSTNSSANDEITLHRAGHAPNAGVIQLRTIRSGNGEAHDLKLQIKHNQTCTGSSDYVFKFRRMI